MGLIDYREDTEGTVDTWEFLDQRRLLASGNPIVPKGVKEITWIKAHFAPDKGADAIVRFASAFRLNGDGITGTHKGNSLVFPGPFGGTSNTGASEQTLAIHPEVGYNVAVPVAEGQEITFEGQFFGEDLGDAQLGMTWGYDMPRPPMYGPTIKASQMREADLADAAEALVALTGDLNGGTSNFTAPPNVSKIAQIAYGVAVDVAVDTRIANAFELDGDGLTVSIKPQTWAGVFGQQRLDTEGGASVLVAPERIWPNWDIVAPRQAIVARAGMVEDDYGAGTAFMALMYT